MIQRRSLLAVGCAVALLSGVLIYFGMTLHGVQNVSDGSSQTPDNGIQINSHLLPADGKTFERSRPAASGVKGGASTHANADQLEYPFENWKETENLVLDQSCRLIASRKIEELDEKISDLKQIAADSHPFDASLASGFSDFQRNGRFYQFSLAQTGKQNEAGEELFRFLLTSAASSETSSPFKEEKFEDQRYVKLVTQGEGRALWDSYVNQLRSNREVKVSEVRYRSFVGSEANDMFEVSNSKLVGYSRPQLGCVNENNETKIKCSCLQSFAD
jgi:hypothetical protein